MPFLRKRIVDIEIFLPELGIGGWKQVRGLLESFVDRLMGAGSEDGGYRHQLTHLRLVTRALGYDPNQMYRPDEASGQKLQYLLEPLTAMHGVKTV